jgi:hypothetical protein
MSGKGAHINVLGERIRRYYEHLMTDANMFVDELRKDLEGPRTHQTPADQTAKPHGTSPPGAASRPVKRSH